MNQILHVVLSDYALKCVGTVFAMLKRKYITLNIWLKGKKVFKSKSNNLEKTEKEDQLKSNA